MRKFHTIKLAALCVIPLLLAGCLGYNIPLKTTPESLEQVGRLSLDREDFLKMFNKKVHVFGTLLRIDNEVGDTVYKRPVLAKINPVSVASADLEYGRYKVYVRCSEKAGQTVWSKNVTKWVELNASEELVLGCEWYDTGKTKEVRSLFGRERVKSINSMRLYERKRLPFKYSSSNNNHALTIEQ